MVPAAEIGQMGPKGFPDLVYKEFGFAFRSLSTIINTCHELHEKNEIDWHFFYCSITSFIKKPIYFPVHKELITNFAFRYNGTE